MARELHRTYYYGLLFGLCGVGEKFRGHAIVHICIRQNILLDMKSAEHISSFLDSLFRSFTVSLPYVLWEHNTDTNCFEACRHIHMSKLFERTTETTTTTTMTTPTKLKQRRLRPYERNNKNSTIQTYNSLCMFYTSAQQLRSIIYTFLSPSLSLFRFLSKPDYGQVTL